MNNRKKAKKRILIAAAAAAAVTAAVLIAVCLYNGILQINGIQASAYKIKGVDVSHYQGDIDWDVLSKQGIRFAYIKATEGSAGQDECFSYNWSEASGTDLRIGAYHFFSFESSGTGQGENFIRNVPAVENMMPPAVDVEPYGAYGAIKTLDASMLAELNSWLQLVEDFYGRKPIIYTTVDFLDQIRAEFPENDIWIRSVYGPPPAGKDWKIWQYSNRTILKGYTGGEKYVDMNVFSGTEEEFSGKAPSQQKTRGNPDIPLPENVLVNEEKSAVSPSGKYMLSLEPYDDNGVRSYKVKVESGETAIISDACYRKRDVIYALWDDESDRVWLYSGDLGYFYWDIERDRLIKNVYLKNSDVKVPEALKTLRPRDFQ